MSNNSAYPKEWKIAKRILREMLHVSSRDMSPNRAFLPLFQGLGIGLGIVFEACTGRRFDLAKPKLVMQWAADLPPLPPDDVVIINAEAFDSTVNFDNTDKPNPKDFIEERPKGLQVGYEGPTGAKKDWAKEPS